MSSNLQNSGCLVKQMCYIGWEIKPAKIQGPATSVKFLGGQWFGTNQGFPSKTKNKLLYFILLPLGKWTVVGSLFRFGTWESCFTSFIMWLWWLSDQERALHQVRLQCKWPYLLGRMNNRSHGAEDIYIKDAVGIVWQVPSGESQHRL